MPVRKCHVFFTAAFLVNIVFYSALNNEAIAALQCYGCHGSTATGDNRPEDDFFRNSSTGAFQGNHQKHLGPGSTPDSCQKCHPGSDNYVSSHRDGIIKLSGNINSSVHPSKARYINSTSSAYINYTSFPQTADKTGRFFLGSCSNVNCHFESPTPVWGTAAFTAPGDCTRCHGAPPAGGAAGGEAGSHARHNDYFNGVNQCIKCHTNHTSFEHATSAGRRSLIVVPKDPLNTPGGSYGGPVDDYLPSQVNNFGSCSDLYCHSNAAPFDKLNSTAAPAWGSGAQACSSCHDAGGSTSGLSGRHAFHTGEAYAFACDRCHTTTVTGNSTIKSTALHVNKTKNVAFIGGGSYSADKTCNSTYCHSDAVGGAPGRAVKWSDTAAMTCYSCHKGRVADSSLVDCAAIAGAWSSAGGYCTPGLTMSSNGHNRLAGPQWIRKYACSNCHSTTVTALTDEENGKVYDGSLIKANHVNGTRDIAIPEFWAIAGKPFPTYSSSTKTCYNVYCHSDGTINPPAVKPFSWSQGKTDCNSCHGHPNDNTCSSCHDGRTDGNNKIWSLPAMFGNATAYKWPKGGEWKAAIPMFRNEGAGSDQANSHPRHVETDFSCDECHVDTVTAGVCNACHNDLSNKKMSEVAHINPEFHVNKRKDVRFKSGGSYKPDKSCSGTRCHTGVNDPVWGGSVNSSVVCLECHGNSNADTDTFGYLLEGTAKAKINMQEWYSTGHGRRASKGPYPVSGNPAASFSGNACWYCHDNNIVHNDPGNFFRLRQHPQFQKRFDKECVFCHMQGTLAECLNCHNTTGSLAPQLNNISSSHIDTARWANRTTAVIRPDHKSIGLGSCLTNQDTTQCHSGDAWVHNTGPDTFGAWDAVRKDDVRNQYTMMGVCLQCHDDDSNNKCTSCHADNPGKYAVGFRPPGFANYSFIKPKKARASSAHFGHKHYNKFMASGGWDIDPVTNRPKGIWRGGKFCWDCHDPHGDKNIYMIQKEVATSTDGKYGIPITRASVSFTRKDSGNDYARISAPYNGICNVCHSTAISHYQSGYGEGHNQGVVCTSCHDHRFSDSHGSGQSCTACHKNKPVPRHSAFGLPRDCTKCHTGAINKRMDIMGQMNGVSHHVQGTPANNKHCYQCHWESTKEGVIDLIYHTGYNYRNYASVKDAPVDLVIWQPGSTPTIGVRPERYKLYTTAIAFNASGMAVDNAVARTEAGKVTNHCLSCHSDQNNDNKNIFDGDCRTPRQYAWDGLSIAARYLQTGTTKWGKYNSVNFPNVPKKDKVIKAFSAHGNAINNGGGFNNLSGYSGTIPNTRGGASNNVQCYDCHSSHGSQVSGVTSSYVTFNGTRNGGNLKETQAGKGGYIMGYKASNTDAGVINPYSVGAGQCFDCHNNQNSGVTPWGYTSTFGAFSPILGYFDSVKFGQTTNTTGIQVASPNFKGGHTIKGGHMKASSDLTTTAQNTIGGLCTPCHDPHGVSPSLGGLQAYAVPLLKGSWMTSPYREDNPSPDPTGPNALGNGWGKPAFWYPEGYPNPVVQAPTGISPKVNYNIDRITFGTSSRISEDAATFAGLCMQCHTRNALLGNYTGAAGTTSNASKAGWKSRERVHATVKGWGGNGEHSYSCSKCHVPHMAGLPRLMVTNCLEGKHRGKRPAGGQPWRADSQKTNSYPHTLGNQHRGYPIGNVLNNSPASESFSSCHGSITDNPDKSNWPNNNGWNNNITNW